MYNRVKSLYSLYTAAEPQRRSPGAVSKKKKKILRAGTQACRLLRRLLSRRRRMEDDQRASASEATVTIETLARCNGWLVDMVRQQHGKL